MSARKVMSAGALNRSAAAASVTVALLLVGLKGWAALATGSAAMLGSLADTALDLVASLATLAGVWIAAQPADAHHRFGHGKAEAIAAIVQVVLISISAVGLAAQSIAQLLDGTRVAAAGEGIGVSLLAIIATLALLAWQARVIRRTGSLAIATDHLHYKSDLALNAAVIAALVLDRYADIPGADGAFGFVIAGWLGWAAWAASRAAVDQLMDHEWAEEKKQRFIAVLALHPDLKGVHDLRTRTSGNRDFVQFHVWVDPNMTLRAAHDIMDALEARLAAAFPDVEILIHPEPEGLVDEEGFAAHDVLAPDALSADALSLGARPIQGAA